MACAECQKWRLRPPPYNVRKWHIDANGVPHLYLLPTIQDNRKYHAKTGRGIRESIYAEIGITESNQEFWLKST